MLEAGFGPSAVMARVAYARYTIQSIVLAVPAGDIRKYLSDRGFSVGRTPVTGGARGKDEGIPALVAFYANRSGAEKTRRFDPVTVFTERAEFVHRAGRVVRERTHVMGGHAHITMAKGAIKTPRRDIRWRGCGRRDDNGPTPEMTECAYGGVLRDRICMGPWRYGGPPRCRRMGRSDPAPVAESDVYAGRRIAAPGEIIPVACLAEGKAGCRAGEGLGRSTVVIGIFPARGVE